MIMPECGHSEHRVAIPREKLDNVAKERRQIRNAESRQRQAGRERERERERLRLVVQLVGLLLAIALPFRAFISSQGLNTLIEPFM